MSSLIESIKEWPQKNEFWIGVLSISIAFGSIVIANSSLEASRQQARTALYIEFKQRFAEFRHKNKPPKERKEQGYVASPTSAGWEYFYLYWHHSFDEWFASTQLLSPEESKLWNEYYGPSVKNALGKSYYLESICYMLSKEELSFPAQNEDFRKALVDLYDHDETIPPCLAKT